MRSVSVAVAASSAAAASAAAATASAKLYSAPLLLLQLLVLMAPTPARSRECPIGELEGIRRDCFYDFEAELADTPSRSFHVMMQQKCNDTMLASYPVMADCVTSRLEGHGCSNGAKVMNRFRLVRTAHEHLCSVRRRGRFCRELAKNLPHYVNLCVESLFDGVRQPAVCAKGVNRRSQMTVQKSQACVHYILNLMSSPCYFLQFNFFHIRTYVEGLADNWCKGGRVASSGGLALAMSAVAAASVSIFVQ